MSTFIVRLVDTEGARFRGKVRHVGSGEEALFGSRRDLLAFIEAMNAVRGGSEGGPSRDEPREEFTADAGKDV